MLLKDNKENVKSSKLNRLQVSVIVNPMDTIDKLKIDIIFLIINSEEEENKQFLTNDKIIKEVIAEEKDNSRNNDDKG
jgi:hypothetical protein